MKTTRCTRLAGPQRNQKKNQNAVADKFRIQARSTASQDPATKARRTKTTPAWRRIGTAKTAKTRCHGARAILKKR